MRLLKDVGCEYDITWVVEELIQENLTTIDCSEIYEQMIEGCYGETVTIGYLELSTTTVMKDQDSISWDIGLGEYLDGLAKDSEVISFGNALDIIGLTM